MVFISKSPLQRAHMAIILLFIFTWGVCFYLRGLITKKTATSKPVARVIFRSLISTLCFGIGVVGGEGFALPGPILAALVFYNGPYYYPYTAILPFFGFLILFIIINTMGLYIKKRETRRRND